MLPATERSLEQLGWDDAWKATFADHAVAEHLSAGLVPARVAVQHRGAYDLMTADGDVRAAATAKLAHNNGLPAVGDWVGLDPASGLIETVLPRRTTISRKEVWTAIREQVLAANVDVVFLTQGLPLDFNPRRLERYLAMAWESGAQPVVLLTKADLVDDLTPFLDQTEAVTLGAVPVHSVSVPTGAGLDEIRPYFTGNRTAVLLGSSGVGKSTIVNALAGEELLATAEVRADDQMGRHTTSHRELVLLPAGGIVLDTPGMRELQLWDADLGQTFSDVEEIAAQCRFSDCAHGSEPGCAVREALADGTLDAERWDSYVKLQREADALELRRNHLLRLERVREYKILERQNRKNKKR